VRTTPGGDRSVATSRAFSGRTPPSRSRREIEAEVSPVLPASV